MQTRIILSCIVILASILRCAAADEREPMSKIAVMVDFSKSF